MYITKEKFWEICKKYSSLLVMEGDAVKALNFVHDLLTAEADAIKEREPGAFVSIDRLNVAAGEVFDICSDVDSETFGGGLSMLSFTFNSVKVLRAWLNKKRRECEGPEEYDQWLRGFFDKGNTVYVRREEYDYWACYELI